MNYVSERRLENILLGLKEGITYNLKQSRSWNASRFINSHYLDFYTLDEDGDVEVFLTIRLADHYNNQSRVDHNLVVDYYNLESEEEWLRDKDENECKCFDNCGQEDHECECECSCVWDYEKYRYELELEAEADLIDMLENVLKNEGVLNENKN